MKIKKIEAGQYELTNDYGFTCLLLKQPEGGWSVFDPNAGHEMHTGEMSGDTLDFFMTKAEAKGFATNWNPSARGTV